MLKELFPWNYYNDQILFARKSLPLMLYLSLIVILLFLLNIIKVIIFSDLFIYFDIFLPLISTILVLTWSSLYYLVKKDILSKKTYLNILIYYNEACISLILLANLIFHSKHLSLFIIRLYILLPLFGSWMYLTFITIKNIKPIIIYYSKIKLKTHRKFLFENFTLIVIYVSIIIITIILLSSMRQIIVDYSLDKINNENMTYFYFYNLGQSQSQKLRIIVSNFSVNDWYGSATLYFKCNNITEVLHNVTFSRMFSLLGERFVSDAINVSAMECCSVNIVFFDGKEYNVAYRVLNKSSSCMIQLALYKGFMRVVSELDNMKMSCIIFDVLAATVIMILVASIKVKNNNIIINYEVLVGAVLSLVVGGVNFVFIGDNYPLIRIIKGQLFIEYVLITVTVLVFFVFLFLINYDKMIKYYAYFIEAFDIVWIIIYQFFKMKYFSDYMISVLKFFVKEPLFDIRQCLYFCAGSLGDSLVISVNLILFFYIFYKYILSDKESKNIFDSDIAFAS